MEYYLLRMLNHEEDISRKLFNNGYVSIGYRKFDEQNGYKFIEIYNQAKNKENILRENIERAWNSRKIGSHWKLDKFFKFNLGDILLIPDNGCFYLVKVISEIISFETIKEKFCEKEYTPDIGFVYKVENLFKGSISRTDFAGAKLTARLKNISGLLNITDLKEEITETINAFTQKKPINLNECIKDDLRKNVLNEIRKNLNPSKFELLITKLMYKIGATTVDIPAKNDKKNAEIGIGDVDVVNLRDF